LKNILFKYLFFVCGLFLWNSLSAQGRFQISGKVVDAETLEPVLYANVVFADLSLGASTNDKGEFILRSVPEGKFNLSVTYIGYEDFSLSLTVKRDTILEIRLRQQSLGLQEVIVTAENSRSGATSSRIKSDAISHVQASSLKDVLQLIPGNLSVNPNLNAPGKISIREVNADVNSALGTSVIVDGIPLSNDGNLQQSIRTTNSITSVAGTGIDIRGISVENIESITVDVGIPSAEHGNLTSGAVYIKTKAGGSPLTVKLKADPHTKQGYIGKGLLLPGNKGVINVDFDYTRSFGQLVKQTSLFNRINGTVKYSTTFFRDTHPLQLESKVMAGSTLDGEKWDPDQLLLEENYSREQSIMASLSANWSVNRSWLSSLSLDAGYSREFQKGFEKSFTSSSSGATFFSTATTDGEYQISYAPSSYYSEVTYDGRPYNLYLKLKGKVFRDFGRAGNNILWGAEWTTTGNNGRGRTFNPERPPVGLGTRPRPFYDIPAISQFSLFAEDVIKLALGKTLLEMMAGVRMDNVQPSGLWSTNGSISVDPRFNLRYQVLNEKNNNWFKDFSIRAGYGKTSKAPTFLHLYPDKDYNDIISFNYYPDLIVATTTVISDTRNYNLKPARSSKKELGIDFQAGNVKARITGFSEKHSGGFANNYVLFPQHFRDYDVIPSGLSPYYVPGSGIYYRDKVTGNEVKVGYEEDVKFSGYAQYKNGNVRIKKGLEYSFDFGKIKSLRTSVNLSGAWFRTESYLLDVPYWEKVDYTVYAGGVSRQEAFAVKFSDQYGYGTVDERLNTNLGLITHIPELKMLISLTTQVIWFEKNKRQLYPFKSKLFTLGELREYLQIPDLFSSEKEGDLYYQLPVAYKLYDNVEKSYAPGDFKDPMNQLGIKKQISTYFPERTLPPLALLNIKLSKDIGKRFKLSFYANNFLNIRPWQLDSRSGRYLRRNEQPFFGADISMQF
jgi:hypothetical protein